MIEICNKQPKLSTSGSTQNISERPTKSRHVSLCLIIISIIVAQASQPRDNAASWTGLAWRSYRGGDVSTEFGADSQFQVFPRWSRCALGEFVLPNRAQS